MIRQLTILIVLLFPFLGSWAQEQPYAGVHVIAKATEQSIKLRWAPTSPMAWKYANDYGYTMEKIVMTENGKVLGNRKVEIVSSFQPAPLAEWEEWVERDDFVAVAAQSIYGEGFEVEENFSSEMMKVINKAREIENRFSFAVYAADMSIDAARLSGLYYEDEEVSAGYQYLYRVYANVPSQKLPLDTGSVFVGLENYEALPPIRNFHVTYGDQLARLSWGGISTGTYNAFWIEKSTDGHSFQRINDVPYVPLNKSDIRSPREPIVALDSLESNHADFYYRVIGIDAFGDLGAPSEVRSGSGRPVFDYLPAIEKAEIVNNEEVIIDWSFPDEGHSLLKSFSVFREDQKSKMRLPVANDLSKDTHHFVDSLPHASNYYIIEATDIYDRSTYSFPHFVQLDDSIPPSRPAGFTGKIDESGKVSLSWKASEAEDLHGYKLYRSNFKEQQFVQVPGPMLQTTTYTDSIALDNLTEKIYYRISALDRRYNESEHSEILELKKPDLIPPLRPLIKKISSDSIGILVQWERSPSEDVELHLLYRQAEIDTDWSLIRQIESGEEDYDFYRDSEVKHGIRYAYTLIAVDDDGLESPPAIPATAKWVSLNPYPMVRNIQHSINEEEKEIRIEWSYNGEGVDRFQVYKSRNGKRISLFRTIDESEPILSDFYTNQDETVSYQIVALFANGDRSPFSEELIINLQ